MKFSQTERGDQQFFCCFQGGIKNLIEPFIPFLPHPPRELKNDHSLSLKDWTVVCFVLGCSLESLFCLQCGRNIHF